MAPEAYQYLDSGRWWNVNRSKGALEYEGLVHEPGRATKQAFGSVRIARGDLILIVFGNLGYIAQAESEARGVGVLMP